MPRSIFTDDVIERSCPEYQPLAHPNAYFNNVGGMLRSEGIKSTPIRLPPRPSRIQYLSSSANIPLNSVRASVDGTQEIAQGVVNDLRVVVRPTAVPIQPVMTGNLLDFTPIQSKSTLENDYFIDEFNRIASGAGEDFIEEAIAFYDNFGERVPNLLVTSDELLEEKGDIPYVESVGSSRTQIDQGDASSIEAMKTSIVSEKIKRGEEEIRRGEEDIKRTEEGIKRTEEQLGLVEEMREFGERSTTQIAEQIKKLREAQAGLQQDPRSLFFASEQERREASLFERAEQSIARSELVKQFEGAERFERAIEGAEQKIAREQAVEKVKQTAKEFAESGLIRGQSRAIVAFMKREQAREARGVAGLTQPPREIIAQKEKIIAPREEQIKAQQELAGLGTRAIIKGEVIKRRPQAKGQKFERDEERRIAAGKAKLRGSYNPFTTELR